MPENVCVVNGYYKLEKKDKKRKQKSEKKKKHVKHVTKSDLIHFSMTICSAFYTDDPGRQCQYSENLRESFIQTIYSEAPKMLKQ